MITPSEETKLQETVLRMKENAELIRRAQQTLAIATSDMNMDCSIIGQFVPAVSADAAKLRRNAAAMEKNLRGLDPFSVWLQANRLAEAAWENRLQPATPQKQQNEH